MRRVAVRRVAVRVAALALGASLLTGCEFRGLNSLSLPFTPGNADNSITVVMANVANLVPNSEVKIGDVTVGSVRSIEVHGWQATLTLALDEGVRVPGNALARVAQKSLLGAEYLDLTPPAGEQPQGALPVGATLGVERTGRYPETEEVLSALALTLTGGGLDQIQTINREFSRTLGNGHEEDVRGVLTRLDTFVGALDEQKSDLVRALEQLDRFAGTVAQEKDTLATALDTVPQGLAALNRQRGQLVTTLDSVGRFGDVAIRVLDGAQDDLISNLRHLQPVLKGLADAGPALPEATGDATFPFPTTAILRSFKGDYINFFATVDLTTERTTKNFASGLPLESVLSGGPLASLPLGPQTQATDPLRVPLQPVPGLPGPAEIPLLPQPQTAPTTPPTGADQPGLLGGLLGGR